MIRINKQYKGYKNNYYLKNFKKKRMNAKEHKDHKIEMMPHKTYPYE